MSVTHTGKLCNTSNKTTQKNYMYINFFQKKFLKKPEKRKTTFALPSRISVQFLDKQIIIPYKIPKLRKGHQTSKCLHSMAAFCQLPIIPLTTLWYFVLMMPRMTLSKNFQNLSRTNENLKQCPNGVEWFLHPHSRKKCFWEMGKMRGEFWFFFFLTVCNFSSTFVLRHHIWRAEV